MSDDLKERIAAIKVAAEKAQKKCLGPWFVDSDDAEECGPHAHSGLFMVNSGRGGDDWDVARLCEATEAAHIAKCDPDSVLALIAEVERLQQENERLTREIKDAAEDLKDAAAEARWQLIQGEDYGSY